VVVVAVLVSTEREKTAQGGKIFPTMLIKVMVKQVAEDLEEVLETE
jgi:hypothetical protein